MVFGPFCAVALQLLDPGVEAGRSWIELLLPTGRRGQLLMQSAGLATGVAISTTALGLLAALALWRCRQGRLSRLKWLALVMAPIPPYIHALAWMTALRFLSGGAVGAGPRAVHGWLLAWWVETMAFLPIAAGLCLLGLEAVRPALIESARVIRSDLKTLGLIVLPLAAPGILGAFVAVLLFSLTDYSVPSIFAVDVYTLEIFAEYSATGNAGEAFLLAAPVSVLAIGAVLVSQLTVSEAASAASPRVLTPMAPLSLPDWFKLIEKGGLFVLGLQILVPLVTLAAQLERPARIFETVQLAAGDIFFSLYVAAMAAVVCLAPALGAARGLLSARGRNRLWWFIAVLPLAVPAPLIGIGLIVIWNRPGLAAFYDSALMPVLAALTRFLPWAALVVLAQMRRVDQSLIEAARVHGKGTVMSWLRVDLPLVAPGIVAAAGIVFALTLGELGATLLVTPPGRSTLTIRIYNYLHYGGSADVAALCLVILGAGLGAALLVWAAMSGWSWLARRA